MSEAREESSAPPVPSRKRQAISRLLIVFLALGAGVPSGFLFARMINRPLVEKLHTYTPDVITRLHDRKGRVFWEYATQRRIVITKDEMAPELVEAIIATEDARFYEHGGIDPKAILRAAIKDLIARKKVEGASTLTQQLAKQVFLTPEKSFRRKINEAFLAVDIEKNFTKDQIFELYANQMYLGHGAYGVEAASRLLFGKHAKELSLPEAAVIAGMIRRPHYYSPIENPEVSMQRRNHVLRRMREVGSIDSGGYDRAIRAPIVLGTFREETPRVGAYFAEEVRKYIEKRYGAEDLYRSGLDVRTTLDLDLQNATEEALQRGLRVFDKRRGFRKPDRNLIVEGIEPDQYEDPAWRGELFENRLYPAVVRSVEAKAVEVRVGGEAIRLEPPAWRWTRRESLADRLRRGDLVHVRFEIDQESGQRRWFLDQLPQVQGAVVVLDVESGEIRALVGGYDFQSSKFNRAVQSLRQVGSLFKPFVYGAAFEKGFTPADTLFDAPYSIQVGRDTYTPRNYHNEYRGIVTIQRALELSINVPAVKTFMMVGANSVIDFTRRSGVTAPLPPYPSLSLGAAGVSPLEMAGAYNAWANQGVYIKPRMVTRITDAKEKLIEENYPELSEATSAHTAYLLSYMMQAVIRRGTGYAAHTLPGVYAGKTGTTNGFTDAWFAGYSPEYTVAVWFGYDDPQRSLGSGATGADATLPVWIDVFKAIDELGLRGEPVDRFEMPPGIIEVAMDLKTGRRGVGPCGRVVMEAFVAGTEPARDCAGEPVAVSQPLFEEQRPVVGPPTLEPQDAIEAAPAAPEEALPEG
ncbi:MAG TPA: PBP1A family penicillin-binding protein [Thermoanaerobaculia bacterium]|nr:PBP1A family penicillin-binding protein [Thermoanaerobaculia bacterium]